MAISPKTIAAGLLCALLLTAPAPAAATVTVSIEFVSSGVIGCGLVFYLYISGSWESGFAGSGLQGALVEVSGGRAHLGVPVPSLLPALDAGGEPAGHETVQVDLLRWRF